MKRLLRFFRKTVTRINPVISNKIMHRALVGKQLNLKNPTTFNDKINWLKLYNYPSNDFVIRCTDKYAVRDFLRKNKLDSYIVKLLGIWDDAREIDWESLPNKFVLKCNHGMGYNIICKDKQTANKDKIIKQLNTWMKEDFGKVSGEPHYSKIKRKIICEEYLGDGLIDIQFWCSYGKILFISYIDDPHGDNHKATFDEQWNKLDFVTSLPKLEKTITKPKRLNDMLKISKKISQNLPFLRFDYYLLSNGDVKISELSFSPASGFVRWEPSKYDSIMGEKIDISKVK